MYHLLFQDPAEYAKYKRDYDAYTDWYNKYAVMYAAKQDKKTQAPAATSTAPAQPTSGNGDKLPDPNDVPRGVDPVAWRKYCNDTREYYAKYKSGPGQTAVSVSSANYNPGVDSKKAMAERIADKILNRRGLGGQ